MRFVVILCVRKQMLQALLEELGEECERRAAELREERGRWEREIAKER